MCTGSHNIHSQLTAVPPSDGLSKHQNSTTSRATSWRCVSAGRRSGLTNEEVLPVLYSDWLLNPNTWPESSSSWFYRENQHFGKPLKRPESVLQVRSFVNDVDIDEEKKVGVQRTVSILE